MKKTLRKILSSFLDKWPIWTAIMCGVLLLIYAYGCEPTTQSILTPDKKVTRTQLKTELEIFEAKLRERSSDLDKQQIIRDAILNQTLIIAQGGDISPFGIITSLLAILGIGATADDIRLRNERKKQITYVPIKNDGPNKS